MSKRNLPQIVILCINYDGTRVETFKTKEQAMAASAEYLKRLCRGHEVSEGTLGEWETVVGFFSMQRIPTIRTRFQHPDDKSLWVEFVIETHDLRTKPSDWNK